jgi:hypothetical protein
MFLWRSTSCTTKFRQKNFNKKENITVQKPGNLPCLINEEDSSANLNTAASTSNLAFSLLFLYSILSSQGLCPLWPFLYKYLWFQKSPEIPRKQDCRWCAPCTVHRLYQNGLEFQGNTVSCTCTNVTSFMPVHEKYDLPYNNFHDVINGHGEQKLTMCNMQPLTSNTQSVTLPIITNMAMATNGSTTVKRKCTYFEQYKRVSEASA